MKTIGNIALKGEVSIYRAAELRETLLTALHDHPHGLSINLSQVNELDSAGVQLLMAAKRTAAGAGMELTFVEHSAQVLEVFELLNLAAFFGDPLLVSA